MSVIGRGSLFGGFFGEYMHPPHVCICWYSLKWMRGIVIWRTFCPCGSRAKYDFFFLSNRMKTLKLQQVHVIFSYA